MNTQQELTNKKDLINVQKNILKYAQNKLLNFDELFIQQTIKHTNLKNTKIKTIKGKPYLIINKQNPTKKQKYIDNLTLYLKVIGINLEKLSWNQITLNIKESKTKLYAEIIIKNENQINPNAIYGFLRINGINLLSE